MLALPHLPAPPSRGAPTPTPTERPVTEATAAAPTVPAHTPGALCEHCGERLAGRWSVSGVGLVSFGLLVVEVSLLYLLFAFWLPSLEWTMKRIGTALPGALQTMVDVTSALGLGMFALP